MQRDAEELLPIRRNVRVEITRFEVEGLAQYSYLVASGGQAAVIDPIRDIDRYLDYARAHSLTITHVLETHIHADFASGGPALAQATGAELALSAYDAGELYQYAMPHRALHTGARIAFGELELEALHTPGHTPEHLSFVLRDAASGETVLFSGDFLFVGSLGRPDLLGEEAKHALVRELYRSVHERIAGLPDDTNVMPGHGAGSFCGSGMADHAESTLGMERATNPLFQLNAADFVRTVLEGVPPMPSYYPRMKALNAAGVPMLHELPGGNSLTPADVGKLSAESDVLLVDLRSAEAFAEAHIPGSINIGAGPSLALWAGWLVDPTKRLVLVGDEGDSAASRLALVRVGLDQIEGTLAFDAWHRAGLPVASITELSPLEVQEALQQAFALDVRNDAEWQSGHIANAHHIMLGDLPDKLDAIPEQEPLLLICGLGYRASLAASLLVKHGFHSVSTLRGGMEAWSNERLPIVSG